MVIVDACHTRRERHVAQPHALALLSIEQSSGRESEQVQARHEVADLRQQGLGNVARMPLIARPASELVRDGSEPVRLVEREAKEPASSNT